MFIDVIRDVATHCPAFVMKMLQPQTILCLRPSSFLLIGEIWPHVLLFRLRIFSSWRPEHSIYDSCFLLRTTRWSRQHSMDTVNAHQTTPILRDKPSIKGGPEYILCSRLSWCQFCWPMKLAVNHSCSSGDCLCCYKKLLSSLVHAFPFIKWAQSELLLCRSWWYCLASQAKKWVFTHLISPHLLRKSLDMVGRVQYMMRLSF